MRISLQASRRFCRNCKERCHVVQAASRLPTCPPEHCAPCLLLQALMSNIGGAATMVGDPPALIIGNALSSTIGGGQGCHGREGHTGLEEPGVQNPWQGLQCPVAQPAAATTSLAPSFNFQGRSPFPSRAGFMDFIVNMAPGVLMAAVACIPLLLWQFRRSLCGWVPCHPQTPLARSSPRGVAMYDSLNTYCRAWPWPAAAGAQLVLNSLLSVCLRTAKLPIMHKLWRRSVRSASPTGRCLPSAVSWLGGGCPWLGCVGTGRREGQRQW